MAMQDKPKQTGQLSKEQLKPGKTTRPVAPAVKTVVTEKPKQ